MKLTCAVPVLSESVILIDPSLNLAPWITGSIARGILIRPWPSAPVSMFT